MEDKTLLREKKNVLVHAVTVTLIQDVYMLFFFYFAGNTLSFTFIEPRWPMLGNTHAE